MAKHLLLNGQISNWRLPADSDVEALRERIRVAMRDGEVIDLQVEMGDDPLHRTPLTLNGSALSAAAIVETAERGWKPLD